MYKCLCLLVQSGSFGENSSLQNGCQGTFDGAFVMYPWSTATCGGSCDDWTSVRQRQDPWNVSTQTKAGIGHKERL